LEPSWIDAEDGFGAALRELGRLFRRARARPLLTLGITLFFVALLEVRAARKAATFESQVVYRVIEGDLEQNTASTPNRALREFIRTVVFSNEAMLDLMKRYKLNPSRLKTAPVDAIEEMRDEDITVEVTSNYFLFYRGSGDSARSAELAIAYSNRDPKVAYEIVCELADLVTVYTENANVARAQREVEHLEESVASARDGLFKAKSDIALKEFQLGRAKPEERTQILFEIDRLNGVAGSLDMRLTEFEHALEAYRLRVQLERHQMGLRFEVIEPPRPARLPPDKLHQLAKLAVIAFLGLLPLVAIGVGAQDRRVRDKEDLRRLGLEPLGRVPPFSGDEVGSLDERLRRMRYTKGS
jgi:hypothetical protein